MEISTKFRFMFFTTGVKKSDCHLFEYFSKKSFEIGSHQNYFNGLIDFGMFDFRRSKIFVSQSILERKKLFHSNPLWVSNKNRFISNQLIFTITYVTSNQIKEHFSKEKILQQGQNLFLRVSWKPSFSILIIRAHEKLAYIVFFFENNLLKSFEELMAILKANRNFSRFFLLYLFAIDHSF